MPNLSCRPLCADPLVLTLSCRIYANQVSKVIKVAYRSWKVLRDAPAQSRMEMAKLLTKHENKKGRGCKGRYALLLAGMTTFTNRAFKIFSEHVSESENHHAVLDRNVVWSNYEQVSAPDVKYEHKIIVNATGKWRCEVASNNKPCWQHRIRGLFCSHMCAFAIAKIRGGGEVNLKAVGLSSLDRHTGSSVQVEEDIVPRLVRTGPYVPLSVDVKKSSQDPAMKQLIHTLSKYFVRVGQEGIEKLNNLVEYRLTGGCAGPIATELVNAFMAVKTVAPIEDRGTHVDKQRRNAYSNNPTDPGNLQRRRMQNAGARAVSAVSTGRAAKRKHAVSALHTLVPHP